MYEDNEDVFYVFVVVNDFMVRKTCSVLLNSRVAHTCYQLFRTTRSYYPLLGYMRSSATFIYF